MPRYFIIRGRGPTMLISPFSTLNNSGSSSKLVLRRNRPNAGRRCSSGSKFPDASRWSVIVRNLYMTNALPPNPGRCWRNSIGEPSLRRTNTANTTKRGLITINPAALEIISNNRFMKWRITLILEFLPVCCLRHRTINDAAYGQS